MDLNKRAISSRPFMKREVAKSRLIYPSRPEAAMRYSYIQHFLEQSPKHMRQTSLGKSACKVICTETLHHLETVGFKE